LELTKHFETRADDNHATSVIAKNLKFFQNRTKIKFANTIIQGKVRFAGIIELTNIIHG
jgi:hypothetical protein